MAFFHHQEETLDRPRLERLQRRKLGRMLSEVRGSNEFYRRKLGGVRFDAARDPIGQLPLTTRAEIQQDQLDTPPYGTDLTYPLARYTRVHQTSGSAGAPLRWLDTPESWDWFCRCWCVVFHAADLTEADRVLFPFSFGPFIGFWSAFDAATRLGALAVSGGGMTTAARLQAIVDHGITVVCCTPTYALHMADVAEAEGIRLAQSTVRALIVAGEPGGNVPATRMRIESAWGARVFDHAGMTEVGAWGFESAEAPGGLHILETEFIAEVIDPRTADPVDDGTPGELVLTNLGRWGMPLIRYRTGDRVVLMRGECVGGRWFARLERGIEGRVDDMLFIRGNNVFPSAIEGILREFDEVAEFRLSVLSEQAMSGLGIEIEKARRHEGTEARRGDRDDASELARRIESTIRDRLHFRPVVSIVPPGTLPRFEMKSRRVVTIPNGGIAARVAERDPEGDQGGSPKGSVKRGSLEKRS